MKKQCVVYHVALTEKKYIIRIESDIERKEIKKKKK